MDEAMAHLEHSTPSRSLTTKGLVGRVFSVACKHLSRLGSRSIENYCCYAKIPRYIIKFFTPEEKELINSKSFEKFEVKLSFKFLKTCCGLKENKHARWSPDKHKKVPDEEKDTFEYLIVYCWNEYDQVLQNSSSLTDSDLNDHIDKILKALILLVEKIEKEKRVCEKALIKELRKHMGKNLDFHDNISCYQHKFVILGHHLAHQSLVRVFNHINCQQNQRMTLIDFLNTYNMNQVPLNERKFLEGNPRPEEMSIRLLYQVVKCVSFIFGKRRFSPSDPLLDNLYSLKEEYIRAPRDEEECQIKCYRFNIILRSAFMKLCEKTGKSKEQISGEPPRVEPLQHEEESDPEDSLPPLPTYPSPFSILTGPSTSLKGELSIEEVNVCVLFKVMRPGGLISQTLAHVFKAFKGNLANTQSNKNAWKNSFTQDEKILIQKLNDDPASIDRELSQKDITFLCKLLRYGCQLSKDDNVWSISSHNKYATEYNITVVRKERSKLAHEVTSIKTEDLMIILNTVRYSLHIILHRAQTFLRNDRCALTLALKKRQSELDDEMQRISQISCDLSLYNEWKGLFDMKDKVKAAAQEELMQSYLHGESMQNMSPIIGNTDSRHKALTIEAVFMERHLEDQDDAKGTYKVEDILFSSSYFKIFIILGRPGDGKTSICKYLCHVWSQDIAASTLKGVDLLFYIPCRYVTVKSLSAYLKGKLPKALGSIKNEDVVPLLQEPQVLFVVDGYDEAGEEAKGLIDEILVSLPDSKMIITTKTQWAPKLIDKVKTVTFNYKVMRIVQMTEEMHEEYAKKFFTAMKQDREDCNSFLTYLDEMKESLNSLTDVSLTFSLLALLWIEEPVKAKKIRTLAELFFKLTDLIIKRVSKQLCKNDTFLFHDWIRKLGEIAWNNLKKKRHYLNELDQESLNRKARELELGSEGYEHMMSSLLFCEIHESLVTDEEKKWTFTFTSQQEYLTAVYLVYEISQNKAMSLKSILELSGEVEEKYKKKLQRLIPVIGFICGLLVIHEEIIDSIKEITEIMSVIEPWSFNSLESMFRCLTQDNAQVKDVVKMMFKNEKMDTFDNFDPRSTLWVLNNTSLDVQKNVTVLSNVNDLLQSVPLLNFLLSKSCEIKVVVDVDKVTNISKLIKLIEDERYKNISFILAPWKPLCISEVITAWTFNAPLHLSLCPYVYPLVWWKLTMCFMTMNKKVKKVVCSPIDPLWFMVIEEGTKPFKMVLLKDFFLMPTEVVIHF